MSIAIEFLTLKEKLGDLPRPYPASHRMPEWLKNMPTDRDHAQGRDPTLKRCPPFLEAMTAGYIIPAPCDCKFTVDEKGMFLAESKYELLKSHNYIQYFGAPFQNTLVLKFSNPWIVRTPPGYSCLFIAPINRFEIPFTALAGIVETDTYYSEVNIPTLCHLRAPSSYTLAEGTPLVQVIPFRREEWVVEYAARDEERCTAWAVEHHENTHAYKEHYWRKHSYT